jgi:hypothetical protein
MRSLLMKEIFVLQRFPGKGSWTYALLPALKSDSNLKVMLSSVIVVIDKIELPPGKLMKIKDGRLFLPVNAGLRKTIGKEAGDEVVIELFIDGQGTDAVSTLMECLADEPNALTNFKALHPDLQKRLIEWISESKSEKVIVERIAKSVTTLSSGGFPFKP